ncbi:MAG: thiamine pyrophosphate-dependent enzyme [archaeon]
MGLPEEELFEKGHRACAGCGASLLLRYVLKATGKDVVVCQATGCMEVVSSPYPETAWKVPWIHAAFENAAAVASGVSRALRRMNKKTNVVALGGDGGTFDIGFQALSGAAERGEKVCYICNDNGAYMNTGKQRSGGTPKYAATTTSPAGMKVHGKTEYKKDMPMIMAAHGAYVATCSIAYPLDIISKIRKGISKQGPAYIQVFTPCPPGWGIASSKTIQVCKLAHETRAVPLYEIEDGIVKITKKPSSGMPVKEYLQFQKRFRHMNDAEIRETQDYVDREWEKLLKLEETQVRL